MKKLEIYWEQPERPRLQVKKKLWEDFVSRCQAESLSESQVMNRLIAQYLGIGLTPTAGWGQTDLNTDLDTQEEDL